MCCWSCRSGPRAPEGGAARSPHRRAWVKTSTTGRCHPLAHMCTEAPERATRPQLERPCWIPMKLIRIVKIKVLIEESLDENARLWVRCDIARRRCRGIHKKGSAELCLRVTIYSIHLYYIYSYGHRCMVNPAAINVIITYLHACACRIHASRAVSSHTHTLAHQRHQA